MPLRTHNAPEIATCSNVRLKLQLAALHLREVNHMLPAKCMSYRLRRENVQVYELQQEMCYAAYAWCGGALPPSSLLLQLIVAAHRAPACWSLW